jgi:hypothetical protein
MNSARTLLCSLVAIASLPAGAMAQVQTSELHVIVKDMDLFNVINKNNIADVNPIWDSAGTPTASYDPRQFQFALRLTW